MFKKKQKQKTDFFLDWADIFSKDFPVLLLAEELILEPVSRCQEFRFNRAKSSTYTTSEQ
jgi:hypothetical protein